LEPTPLTQRFEELTSRPCRPQRLWLHLLLFLLTLFSTTLTWPDWAGRWLLYERLGYGALLTDGLRFSLPLLLILTVHELGHYLAARRHRIDATLPYYIPFPFNGIGTFGAVIRIREPIPDTRTLFDIGVAGPLAGFVVALLVLLYALITLPPPTYLLDVPGHETLKAYIQTHGRFPSAPLPSDDPASVTLVLGPTLLFDTLAHFFPYVPPMYELYHYPTLFAAWLGLFFTALNLLPVGQLDGGHVLYALLGSRWHRRLARAFVVLLLLALLWKCCRPCWLKVSGG
jgi:membrane-associated protease RseP (regulator of RpoE activity)